MSETKTDVAGQLMKFGLFHKFYNEKGLFILSFAIIFLYLFPYIYFGEDSSLLIHDNLDSNVAWAKILLQSGDVFSLPSTNIPQVLKGISRSSLYASYDLALIWFKVFGIYWGYVINKILISFVAFFGMYYLLKRHFLQKDVFLVIPFGVALIFALLPFWSYSMSVSGLPILLFAFLNLRKKNSRISDWLIIFLFPFYSSLVLSGLFFIILITAILIYDFIKSKSVDFLYLGGIILLGSMYIISHINLFYSFIYSKNYVSHRVEFSTFGISAKAAFNEIVDIFTKSQFYSHSLQTFILIPIFFGLFLMVKSKKLNKWYLLILVYIIVTSVFYGLLDWDLIMPLNKKLMSIIPIQLNRFSILHPMFWYMLLGLALSLIAKQIRFGKQMVVLILGLQLFYVLTYNELFQYRRYPSFRQFYAEEQFQEIEAFIGKPKNSYHVISLGIHPAISQFNGFYTLDSYCADYPLAYKHKFRKIIAKELEKSSEIKDYFDNWGSRCYAFSSEIGCNYAKFGFDFSNQNKIEHLDFDYDALREMGGEFVFSNVEINTAINSRLKLLRMFENNNSYWKIYLYTVL